MQIQEAEGVRQPKLEKLGDCSCEKRGWETNSGDNCVESSAWETPWSTEDAALETGETGLPGSSWAGDAAVEKGEVGLPGSS